MSWSRSREIGDLYWKLITSVQLLFLYNVRVNNLGDPFSWSSWNFVHFSDRVVSTPAPGSNLFPGNQLSWFRFSWFSSVPPGEWHDSTLKLATITSYQILSNSLSFTYHTVISAIVWLLKKRCKINTNHLQQLDFILETGARSMIYVSYLNY
jgi:hypothetical protein